MLEAPRYGRIYTVKDTAFQLDEGEDNSIKRQSINEKSNLKACLLVSWAESSENELQIIIYPIKHCYYRV